MVVSYKKLWKLLIDKDLMKKDLQSNAGVSWATITKMSKGETVSTEVLMKICKYLQSLIIYQPFYQMWILYLMIIGARKNMGCISLNGLITILRSYGNNYGRDLCRRNKALSSAFPSFLF